MEKSAEAFRTISEVAEFLETPAHVLRFWESRFPQIRPVKRAGGRRYYRPADVALLSGIRRLLHDEGMTIRGVQKILREQGVRHVAGLHDAPQDDAYDAMTAAAEAPEQTGFAFDAPGPLGEVIRPQFGAVAARIDPATDTGEFADAEDARDLDGDWPAAEPPLLDQPFAETGTDDLPHWGEAAPDESTGDPADGFAPAAADMPQTDDTWQTDEGLWEATASPVDLAGDSGDESAALPDNPAPEADQRDQTGDDAPEDDAANLWADVAAEPHGGAEPDSQPASEPGTGFAPDEDDEAHFAAAEDSAALPQDNATAPESDPESAPDSAPDPAEAAPPVWLPSLLRALPPAALAGRQTALLPLVARLAALRDRMAEAARASRK
ncbi:MerR family transcriptional regulator [Fertoeibacter niger]|uniref:MerR family transcriptional regulator n=1 Tax=Fertoeibacter niger TaxID=2656921 RepID=UPI001F4D0B24|nr:MerR family transcriptional regulator [Fertoeibacter niger]